MRTRESSNLGTVERQSFLYFQYNLVWLQYHLPAGEKNATEKKRRQAVILLLAEGVVILPHVSENCVV